MLGLMIVQVSEKAPDVFIDQTELPNDGYCKIVSSVHCIGNIY